MKSELLYICYEVNYAHTELFRNFLGLFTMLFIISRVQLYGAPYSLIKQQLFSNTWGFTIWGPFNILFSCLLILGILVVCSVGRSLTFPYLYSVFLIFLIKIVAL